MSPNFSLVIPAYNEEARLGQTLQIVFAYLEEHVPASEVIVVDDGSSDKTPRIAEESFASTNLETRLIRVNPNRGKGHAVHLGLLDTRAPVAIFSDADLSTPITELPELLNPIEKGEYDVVFGSRALNRALIGTRQSWRREQGGKAVNLLVRARTGLPFYDTQCGFKAFRMSALRPLVEAARIERFGFDIELLYLAHRAGMRMLETPVRWNHYEGSKLSPARDGLRMLGEVQAIRRHASAGSYDAALAEARRLLAATAVATRVPQALDSDPQAANEVSPELAAPAGRI